MALNVTAAKETFIRNHRKYNAKCSHPNEKKSSSFEMSNYTDDNQLVVPAGHWHLQRVNVFFCALEGRRREEEACERRRKVKRFFSLLNDLDFNKFFAIYVDYGATPNGTTFS